MAEPASGTTGWGGAAVDRAQRPADGWSTEFGLFWAISPAERRCGYASEAATALVDYAFERLRLARIVATTDRTNIASLGVMRRLGMRIAHNPLPEPAWFQLVGILERPADDRGPPSPAGETGPGPAS
jgi:RimJ/RimL family protein N-acetyltransferase